MSQAKKTVGRPVSNVRTAQAHYATLKKAASAAKSEFDAFEKHCIETGLLTKTVIGFTPIPNPATERKKFERKWSDGKLA